MSRLDEIFDKTISDYNENTSDINKFSFSKREKDIFKGMIRRYAYECCKACLEKASEKISLIENETSYVKQSEINIEEHIILL